MRRCLTYRLISILLLILLAMIGVIWYYNTRLDDINREIEQLNKSET